MTLRANWVVGGGGLLGSAVVRSLLAESQLLVPGPAISWGAEAAGHDVARGVDHLIDTADGRPWRIFWCAGAAVTDSDPATLEQELDVLHHLLDALAALPAAVRSRGVVAYASSAGAVYGGSSHPPYTESTPPAPLGRYGAAKLRAEALLREFAGTSGVAVFIARIANLYGPGQNLTKQQGLISRLCMSALTREPISVFVSLDTLRDYLYVDDCARLLTACVDRAAATGAGRTTTKILCSGQAISIAGVLGLLRGVSPTRPLVVMGSSGASGLQGRDLRLRSEYWTDLDAIATTPLAVGIDRTMRDLLGTWVLPGALAAARAEKTGQV